MDFFNQRQMPFNNQQIIRVNGENGANMFQMMPNSSALLLDENSPKMYLVQTDGAGYKTITAYKLEPIQSKPQISLEERIKRLEDKLNEQSSVKHDTRQK